MMLASRVSRGWECGDVMLAHCSSYASLTVQIAIAKNRGDIIARTIEVRDSEMKCVIETRCFSASPTHGSSLENCVHEKIVIWVLILNSAAWCGRILFLQGRQSLQLRRETTPCRNWIDAA